MDGLKTSKQNEDFFDYLERELKISEDAKNVWQQARKIGIPSLQDENWQNTFVRNILRCKFKKEIADISKEQASIFLLNTRNILAYVNGNISEKISIYEDQLSINRLNHAQEIQCPWQDFLYYITKSASFDNTHRISLLDTKNPLYIPYLQKGKDENIVNFSSLENNIHIPPGCTATIIEHYLNVDALPSFNSTRLNITLGKNAHLIHYKIFDQNIDSYSFCYDNVYLHKNSHYKGYYFLLGGKWTRLHYYAKLLEENANFDVKGLSVPLENSCSDIRGYVEHDNLNTYSNQAYKAIVAHKARSLFDSLIKVNSNADHTDAYMSCKSLLLSLNSKVHVRPRLEIYADEVSCSHGATVGNLDPLQIFYLRSRGISEQEAKKMLIIGFVEEILGILDLSLDKMIRSSIMDRILA